MYKRDEALINQDVLLRDTNCLTHKTCEGCFQPNPKKCSKINEWNPRKKYMILSFMLTDECNLNCSFCWQKRSGVQLGTFTVEMIDKVLEYFYNNFNEYSIVIAVLGGEPSLRPDLIEAIAKKQLELYDKCSLRVYTNGWRNLDQLLEICHKYENITFQVSQNHEMILFGDFVKYCETGNVVVEESDDFDLVYEKIKHIKSLGYRNAVISFNINDDKVLDKVAYFKRGLALLEKVMALTDDTFTLSNIRGDSYHIVGRDEYPYNINIFPDGKFYLTHYCASIPIGDINSPLDLNILLKVYEECPCRNCANEDVCGIYSTPQTIKYDLTQEKRDTICVLNLINAESGRRFKRDRAGKEVELINMTRRGFKDYETNGNTL